jgi:hypothetical protein
MIRHIVFLGERFLPSPVGGAGSFARDLSFAYGRRGVRVDMICQSCGPQVSLWEPYESVRVHHLPVCQEETHSWSLEQTWSYISEHIDLAHADAIHDNGGFFCDFLSLEMQMKEFVPDTPFIAHLQVQWIPLLVAEGLEPELAGHLTRPQRTLCDIADRVVFTSEEERARGIVDLGIQSGRNT